MIKSFLKHQIASDYSWSQVAVLLKTIKGVFIFFLINSNYSVEKYGIFILISSLPSSLSLFDFGIGRFIFGLLSKNRDEGIDKISTLMLINTAFSIIISSIYIGFNYVLLEEKINSLESYLVPLFVLAFLTSQDKLLISSLRGLKCFNERDKWIVIIELIHGIVILLYLWYHVSIVWISILFLSKNVFTYIFDLALLYLRTKFSLKYEKLTIEDIRLIKGYALDSVVSFFSAQSDKYLIPVLLSVETLGIYAFSMKGVNIAKSLLGIIIERNSYNLLSQGGYKRGSYLKASTLTILFIAGTFSLLMLIMQEKFYDQFRIYIVYIASCTLLVNSFFSVEYRSAFQTNRQFLVIRLNVIGVTMNIALSILLSFSIGVYAFVLGSLLQSLYILYNKPRIDEIFNIKQ